VAKEEEEAAAREGDKEVGVAVGVVVEVAWSSKTSPAAAAATGSVTFKANLCARNAQHKFDFGCSFSSPLHPLFGPVDGGDGGSIDNTVEEEEEVDTGAVSASALLSVTSALLKLLMACAARPSIRGVGFRPNLRSASSSSTHTTFFHCPRLSAASIAAPHATASGPQQAAAAAAEEEEEEEGKAEADTETAATGAEADFALAAVWAGGEVLTGDGSLIVIDLPAGAAAAAAAAAGEAAAAATAAAAVDSLTRRSNSAKAWVKRPPFVRAAIVAE
jgi:hypothetical protein